jgi:hypothetical protein
MELASARRNRACRSAGLAANTDVCDLKEKRNSGRPDLGVIALQEVTIKTLALRSDKLSCVNDDPGTW